MPASTQGLNWGGLVCGAAQVPQLSPSSRGLATLGMWLPMGDVEAHRAARPDLLGATGHSPGSGLSGLGPNFVALHGSSHDEEDHGSSHNEEDLTTAPKLRAAMLFRSRFLGLKLICDTFRPLARDT